MPNLYERLTTLDTDGTVQKQDIVDKIKEAIAHASYELVELNDSKPWGAYFRIDNDEANKFVPEMFNGISANEARLGIEDAQLSPKILLVSPKQRLSEQYHDRRAERWHFLTSGLYIKSKTPGSTKIYNAKPGDIVQFDRSEIHRLIGQEGHYTVVAEIWQHSDPSHLSDEDDIVRLADDYQR